MDPGPWLIVGITPGVLDGGMGLCMPGCIGPLPEPGPFIIAMLPPGPPEPMGPAMEVMGPELFGPPGP